MLEALCDTGRVNAEQRKYLEIRMLAGLDRQEELAHNSSLLKAVMDLSLPPQTIVDLVDALYTTFVGNIANDPASKGALGKGSWGSGDWLSHVLRSAQTPNEIAFAYGFLTHAAADVFAHTL